RRSQPTLQVTLVSEARFSKSCAGFTAPITWRSPSPLTNSTAKPATTMETFVHIGRGASQIFHRQKKRTGRAASILAFIGPSIRRRESLLVVAWAITYSITLSGRRIRAEAVSYSRRKFSVWPFECVGQLARRTR